MDTARRRPGVGPTTPVLMEPVAGGPADDAPGKEVNDDRKVEPALACPPESARGRTHRLGGRDNRCGRQHRRTSRDRRARHWPVGSRDLVGGLPEAPDKT